LTAWKNSPSLLTVLRSISARLFRKVPALTHNSKKIGVEKLEFDVELFGKDPSGVDVEDILLKPVLPLWLVEVLDTLVCRIYVVHRCWYRRRPER
jgi:hypothetical protein